jgi:hypothetical protein
MERPAIDALVYKYVTMNARMVLESGKNSYG